MANDVLPDDLTGWMQLVSATASVAFLLANKIRAFRVRRARATAQRRRSTDH